MPPPPSQAQSSNKKPSNNKDEAVKSSNLKQKKKSFLSSQFKTAVEKSSGLTKSIPVNRKVTKLITAPKTWYPTLWTFISSFTEISINFCKIFIRIEPEVESFSLRTGRGESIFSSKAQSNRGFPCQIPDDLVADIDMQAKFDRKNEKVKLFFINSIIFQQKFKIDPNKQISHDEAINWFSKRTSGIIQSFS